MHQDSYTMQGEINRSLIANCNVANYTIYTVSVAITNDSIANIITNFRTKLFYLGHEY